VVLFERAKNPPVTAEGRLVGWHGHLARAYITALATRQCHPTGDTLAALVPQTVVPTDCEAASAGV